MRRTSGIGSLLLLSLIAVLLFCCDLLIGTTAITPLQLWQALTGGNVADDISTIITLFRLPKAYTAVLAGAALPVAGIMMQTFFRNPVAGPDILGVTAGSGLFVAVVMMAGGMFFGIEAMHGMPIVIAAIIGAVAMLLVILVVAARLRDTMTLLIFGIMFGMAISAVVSVLQYYSERGALKLFMLWTFGSLGGVTYAQLVIMAPLVIAGLIASWLISRQLNLLLLGEQYAISLGVRVQRVRLLVIVTTGVLTGTITAFCGPIAFIGIAIPHLARMIFRVNDHRLLIPGTALLGIIVMLICDMLTQISVSAGVLPLNAVTAFMGAPFVIYIIWKNQHLKRTF